MPPSEVMPPTAVDEIIENPNRVPRDREEANTARSTRTGSRARAAAQSSP
jgi:hypothetical protein